MYSVRPTRKQSSIATFIHGLHPSPALSFIFFEGLAPLSCLLPLKPKKNQKKPTGLACAACVGPETRCPRRMLPSLVLFLVRNPLLPPPPAGFWALCDPCPAVAPPDPGLPAWGAAGQYSPPDIIFSCLSVFCLLLFPPFSHERFPVFFLAVFSFLFLVVSSFFSHEPLCLICIKRYLVTLSQICGDRSRADLAFRTRD